MGQAIACAPKVLVVEDEALIRLHSTMLVESLGYEVLEAENADEAIRILEAYPDIRVVFTDINMTGSMDGLELAAFARDRWPPLQFIVVSGAQHPAPSDLPSGARFFSKPYDNALVSHALRALVERTAS